MKQRKQAQVQQFQSIDLDKVSGGDGEFYGPYSPGYGPDGYYDAGLDTQAPWVPMPTGEPGGLLSGSHRPRTKPQPWQHTPSRSRSLA